MSDHIQDELTMHEELFARAIGHELINWAKEFAPDLLKKQINTDAVLLLNEIQCILNDETLDDPDCFYRIDAIVSAFYGAGLSTSRHWELE